MFESVVQHGLNYWRSCLLFLSSNCDIFLVLNFNYRIPFFPCLLCNSSTDDLVLTRGLMCAGSWGCGDACPGGEENGSERKRETWGKAPRNGPESKRKKSRNQNPCWKRYISLLLRYCGVVWFGDFFFLHSLKRRFAEITWEIKNVNYKCNIWFLHLSLNSQHVCLICGDLNFNPRFKEIVEELITITGSVQSNGFHGLF